MNLQDKFLIIFGASSYAKSIAALASNKYKEIKVCIDDHLFDAQVTVFNGLEIIPFSRALKLYREQDFVVGVGYTEMRAREAIFNRLKKNGLKIVSVISPNAIVNQASLGPGVVIFDGVVVETGACVEENVTIWSNSTICHDCHLGAHTFVAAGSIIGGGAKVGRLSFIGFNSVILQELNVGEECLVAAGSIVISNIKAHSKVIGQPARVLSKISTRSGVTVK